MKTFKILFSLLDLQAAFKQKYIHASYAGFMTIRTHLRIIYIQTHTHTHTQTHTYLYNIYNIYIYAYICICIIYIYIYIYLKKDGWIKSIEINIKKFEKRFKEKVSLTGKEKILSNN